MCFMLRSHYGWLRVIIDGVSNQLHHFGRRVTQADASRDVIYNRLITPTTTPVA